MSVYVVQLFVYKSRCDAINIQRRELTLRGALTVNDHTTIPTKRCTKCGEYFPPTAEYFYRDKKSRDRLRSACKTCVNECIRVYRAANPNRVQERQRAYRAANLERELERNREWYEANKERVREYKRAYRIENLERERERSRTWYEANKDRVREYNRVRFAADPEGIRERQRRRYAANPMPAREQARAWRAANLERAREMDRAYRKANPERLREKARAWSLANPERTRENSRIRAQNRRARLRDLPDTLTAVQSQFATEYWNGCCAYCGRQFYDLFNERALALDHYIPLSSPDCPGTVASNMLPACHGVDGCNNSKGNRDPKEWLEDRFGKRKARAILARIEAYFEVVRAKSSRDPARRDGLLRGQVGD